MYDFTSKSRSIYEDGDEEFFGVVLKLPGKCAWREGAPLTDKTNRTMILESVGSNTFRVLHKPAANVGESPELTCQHERFVTLPTIAATDGLLMIG